MSEAKSIAKNEKDIAGDNKSALCSHLGVV